jgi:hypothetical protein
MVGMQHKVVPASSAPSPTADDRRRTDGSALATVMTASNGLDAPTTTVRLSRAASMVSHRTTADVATEEPPTTTETCGSSCLRVVEALGILPYDVIVTAATGASWMRSGDSANSSSGTAFAVAWLARLPRLLLALPFFFMCVVCPATRMRLRRKEGARDACWYDACWCALMVLLAVVDDDVCALLCAS